MSRIGKKPIAIPAGVKVSVSGDAVEIQGPKGKLRQLASRDECVAALKADGFGWLDLVDATREDLDGQRRGLQPDAVRRRGRLRRIRRGDGDEGENGEDGAHVAEAPEEGGLMAIAGRSACEAGRSAG